ncbi:sodium:solute symporter family protein [Opitutus sp. ER46]|uniref:sodium:solute symporter family protein n=1 Tax=Opitutus sp. ER46 TaxID=2161864 RepID=UPI000D314821|nr:sodium:solute symporter family protein [Opitutus sp. ER46]PTX94340.1 sodium:proline symporter [Opitutus sp. ER46]
MSHSLVTLDWIILGVYFAACFVVGLYYTRRASRNTDEFFVGGRSMAWWLIGTSMVATTFSADTPLAVTGLVAKHGIAGNWLWWCLVPAGTLSTYFFAPLWRRAEVLTDIELNELRFSGPEGRVLRGFRAVYSGVIANSVTMGWVILAMAKIFAATFGWPHVTSLFVCCGVTLIYTMMSGYLGVVATDFFQFILAMAGSIILAIYAVDAVGGIDALTVQLDRIYGADKQLLDFIPDSDSAWMPLSLFLVHVGVQWWASGSVVGSGYLAQRMASCKNEKESIYATLLYTVAHYTLRSWPWILVALASMVVYPHLADAESGYPRLIFDTLPAGFRGLLVTSFLAAFMSTLTTHLNWGSSYLVNDLYRRFIRRDAPMPHYVCMARAFTVFLMLTGSLASLLMQEISGVWRFLIALEGGIGLLFIAKWYWWRVNPWSEISCMLASITASVVIRYTTDWGFGRSLVVSVGIATVTWIAVTFLTKPSQEKTLLAFYAKTRPGYLLWKPIADKLGIGPKESDFRARLVAWMASTAMIYLMLFGVGKLIFGHQVVASLCLLGAIATGAVVVLCTRRLQDRSSGAA